LTTEETEAAKSTGVRPLGQYDVKDHFPTLVPELDGAHLPATPVIPVPNDAAKGLQPIVNTINTQDLHATITSSNRFDGNRHLLVTTVDFHGLSSDKLQRKNFDKGGFLNKTTVSSSSGGRQRMPSPPFL
jgi:hypothetical protein